MRSIKLLKDWQGKKIGDIINMGDKGADFFISEGVAEEMGDLPIEEVKPENDSKPLKEPVLGANNKFVEKEKLLKKNENDKKIKKIKTMNLPIDNYYENSKRFYSIQPFFYDKTGMFWFWQENDSKYEQVDDIDVMIGFDNILGFNGQTVNSKVKANTLEAMKRVGRLNIPKPAPNKWIQFEDKAYSLESGNIYDVTPDYFFTNPIPWKLGDSEDTPTMDKLFEEWVGKEYVKTLYQIISYCCLNDYPIHLIFCLVGCGRNGKSKFQGLLNNFIGKENICSTELDTLIDSRFESFKLYKKLVCSMGETNFGVLSKTSLLKKLTGQDLIGFEFKNKKPFDDYNYAKIMISSNSLPSSEDTSEGFYRRWMIIDFPNIFPEGIDILKTIPKYEYNNLSKKVCNILKELLKNNQFHNQGTIKQRKQRYIFSSNPLSFFIELACDRNYKDYMRYGELYISYRKYLSIHKKRAINYKEFNEILAIEGLEVQKTSKKVEDEWVNGRFILGVILKDNWKELIDCDSNDACAVIYPQTTHRESECKYGHKRHKSHNEEINLSCHICGSNPCIEYDETAQGKPICEACKLAKHAQVEDIK